jgi:chromosomal replication initiation ATPase DnaA
VGIGAPDDALLAAILAKLFHDRQVQVSADVISYLLSRIERSFAAARDIARKLDVAALGAKRPITVPLARRVLEDL